MKNKLFSFRRLVISGLGLSLGVLFCTSASAQLLKNGNFESEFPVSDPTAGWELVFVECGRADLSIAGPTLQARRGSSGRGAHLRAIHPAPTHAYFRQVVTNLVPGQSYTLDIQKMAAGFQSFVDNGKLIVYTSIISGAVSNAIVASATVTPYSTTISAAADGRIEIQLHLKKLSQAVDDSDQFKSTLCSAFFDDYSLTLTP